MDETRRKRVYGARRLREETATINGVTVQFYRCPKKRRWEWKAVDAEVFVALTDSVTLDSKSVKAQDTN